MILKHEVVVDALISLLAVLLPLITSPLAGVSELETRCLNTKPIVWQDARPSYPLMESGAVAPGTGRSEQVEPAVLIELFISKGCSTCAPADALLANAGKPSAMAF